jgi:hypothetical protein
MHRSCRSFDDILHDAVGVVGQITELLGRVGVQRSTRFSCTLRRIERNSAQLRRRLEASRVAAPAQRGNGTSFAHARTFTGSTAPRC